jgi:hypothetical protein
MFATSQELWANKQWGVKEIDLSALQVPSISPRTCLPPSLHHHHMEEEEEP